MKIETLRPAMISLLLCATAERARAQLTEEDKLVASDAQNFDSLGYSCAISGDDILITAPDEDHGGKNAVGAAYVFHLGASGWSQQAKLISSDGAAGDKFGAFVDLEGDTAVVSSWRANHSGLADAGAAYVFERSGSTWTEVAKLTASDAAAHDTFYGVALAGDTIVVGALQADPNGITDAGAAYVFTRVGGVWSEQAKLTASDAAASDFFGWSIALAGDTAVISAPFADLPGAADAGALYVFERSGTSWSELTKLVTSDAATGDQLGGAVDNLALSGDTLLVGAMLANLPGANNAGAAYVFVRSGSSWSEQAKLTALNAASGDNFGWGVALLGDRALIGSPGDDDAGASSGSAFLFERAGTSWSQTETLGASDASPGDELGISVAMSASRAVAGAWRCEGGVLTLSGGAYVFCISEAVASFRNSGANPASYSCGVPELGQTFLASVDLSTSGHAFARLVAYTASGDVALPGGQHFLCAGARLGVTPPVPGPLASFVLPLPASTSLCGLTLTTQAVHLGTVTPFALSNAQDLVLGH